MSRESTVKKRENIIDCIIFKRNACFPLHLTKMRKVYFNYWTRRQKIIDLINRTKIKYIVQGFLFNYYIFFFLHWKFYSNKESVLVGECVCTILNTWPNFTLFQLCVQREVTLTVAVKVIIANNQKEMLSTSRKICQLKSLENRSTGDFYLLD